MLQAKVGRGDRVVERWIFGREDRVSKPPVVERPTFQSKGPGFKATYCRFETWATSFTPLCLCLSEETVKVSDSARICKRHHIGKWIKPVVDSQSW